MNEKIFAEAREAFLARMEAAATEQEWLLISHGLEAADLLRLVAMARNASVPQKMETAAGGIE